MKTVTSFEAVRDVQQKGDTVCKTCKRKVEKIDSYFSSIKNRLDSKMDMTVKELREEFKKSIREGDFNAGENIQDVGDEGKATPGRSE
jgi:hypothetical protein